MSLDHNAVVYMCATCVFILVVSLNLNYFLSLWIGENNRMIGPSAILCCRLRPVGNDMCILLMMLLLQLPGWDR